MKRFTSGTWKACIDGSIDIFDENGELVSTYSDVIERKSEEQLMSDARLIAAAPEMYELLKFFTKEPETITDDSFDDFILAIDEGRTLLDRIDDEGEKSV